jgi:hypothetical protein
LTKTEIVFCLGAAAIVAYTEYHTYCPLGAAKDSVLAKLLSDDGGVKVKELGSVPLDLTWIASGPEMPTSSATTWNSAAAGL